MLFYLLNLRWISYLLIELPSLDIVSVEEEDAVFPLFAYPTFIFGHLYPFGGCILDEIRVLLLCFIEHQFLVTQFASDYNWLEARALVADSIAMATLHIVMLRHHRLDLFSICNLSSCLFVRINSHISCAHQMSNFRRLFTHKYTFPCCFVIFRIVDRL